MRSSFFGIDIGMRAMMAQQRALDVTGHNIANAHTPGFSRQRLEIYAADPMGYHVGAGVDVGDAIRLRDVLLDYRYHAIAAKLSEWESRKNVLDQMQNTMGEPGEHGISGMMDSFWSALQELSNHPESVAARRALVEAGAGLADVINQTHHGLKTIRSSLDELLRAAVGEVNAVLEQLDEVNKLIFSAAARGDKPNDLMDRRDLLLDELSGLIGITVQHESSGDVTVFCGSHRILDIGGAKYIDIEIDAATSVLDLTWQNSGAEFVPVSGETKGLLAAREEYLPQYIADLEMMVSDFVTAFNELHRQGYGLDGVDNRDFFVSGGTAGNLAVNPDLFTNSEYIAASASGEPGDGSHILKLAELRFLPFIAGTTFDDFFNSTIARLGTLAQRADGIVEANRNIGQTIEIKRQSVSGVSIDEEVANLLRYQHAYNAAATFVATYDEILDTLINRLGR